MFVFDQNLRIRLRRHLDHLAVRRLVPAHARRRKDPGVSRIARVGLGDWGRRLDVAILRDKFSAITACYDTDEKRTREYARQLGCEPAASYDEILRQDRRVTIDLWCRAPADPPTPLAPGGTGSSRLGRRGYGRLDRRSRGVEHAWDRHLRA